MHNQDTLAEGDLERGAAVLRRGAKALARALEELRVRRSRTRQGRTLPVIVEAPGGGMERAQHSRRPGAHGVLGIIKIRQALRPIA